MQRMSLSRCWNIGAIPMIEPVRHGRDLIDEIAATVPPAGSLSVW